MSVLGVLWELPQTLLGAGLAGVLALRGGLSDVRVRRGRLTLRTSGIGISLGYFVFHTEEGSRYFRPDPLMLQHELGHAVQSRWLGPGYLALVGVPSSARAIYSVVHRELTGERWSGYYDGWPEASADRLGGITRAQRRAQQRDV